MLLLYSSRHDHILQAIKFNTIARGLDKDDPNPGSSNPARLIGAPESHHSVDTEERMTDYKSCSTTDLIRRVIHGADAMALDDYLRF